jgi:hypothetical protein
MIEMLDPYLVLTLFKVYLKEIDMETINRPGDALHGDLFGM